MNNRFCIYALVFMLMISCDKELTGDQLLERSISYHDPDNNWGKMNCTMDITAEYPDGRERFSSVRINLPGNEFYLKEKRDGHECEYKLNYEGCQVALDGNSDLDQDTIDKFRLTCERGNTMKDYYTYLYGLPMKLHDAGTIIDQKVEKKTFMDKEYLTLKVTYDPEVGSDTWYFYFDPETFKMEVYQFYHDESKNDGEYILLENEIEFRSMRIPKTRSWYLNTDDKFLATDHLGSIK